MKIFIYYSLSGNGDVVKTKMESLGYDIVKVETQKNMPKAFFFRIMVGGFEASISKRRKIKDIDLDLKKYDEVVIGSPIWNGRISSPINTVLSKYSFDGKKMSFILYAGSGEAKPAMKKIAKLYPNAEVKVLKEPKSNEEELKKIEK